MITKNFIKSIFNVTKFEDEEKNRVAGIINTLGIVLLTGLAIVVLQRVFFDSSNFLPETLAASLFLVTALVVIRTGKTDFAACLVIYPMYGLIVFLVVTNYGIHDSALYGIPGLLVIAGLMFKRSYFFIYTVVCILTIVLLGVFEINGIIKNEFSYKTVYLDIVDISVITIMTSIGIWMFSERLTTNLNLARSNEKAVTDSEQKVRALISTLPDLVLRISEDGTFKDFAAPAGFPLIYKSEDFLGKKISDLFPKEISDKAMHAIKEAIKNNSVEQIEYRLIFDNAITDWEARFVSLDGKDVINVVRDISERKRTEEALKLNEEIFRSFMEYSPIYVFFKDQDIRTIRLSKNYEKMLNMPLEQMIGKTMFELFPSELARKMTEDDKKILEHGKMVKVVEELNGKIYETVKFPIVIQDKPKYLAGYTIDITETKKYEQRLRQYAVELKEANNAKEKFFSIIAHDLRSPFLGILGSIQMLMTEYHTLSDEERKLLIERVGSSIRKTFELLENLLHWSRMQSGKIVATPVELCLKRETEQVITLLQDFAQNKNVEINCGLKAWHMVKIDKDMFKTIIRNLISNAIKFSIPGGRINVSSEDTEDAVVVKVADNGVGMDAETLNKLFTTDENQSRLGTSNEGGTGIGLLVCKEMIELNNGNIWVESSEGAGSSFYFTIPKAG